MLAILSLLAAAVAPGLALLSYFYLKDRYESEPIRMVGKMFAVGFLVVFPVMVIQRGIMLVVGDNPYVFAFFVSGGIEEFFKWFLVLFLIFAHAEFDEPYDGIVYAVAVSLGFATFENMMVALNGHTTVGSLMMRAILPVSGHALFAVTMGYYFGKAKFNPSRKKGYLTAALLVPVVWHGAFDLIMLQGQSPWVWLIAPFMALLWGLGLQRVKKANLRSPIARISASDEVNLLQNRQ